jgi:hypothetical protein
MVVAYSCPNSLLYKSLLGVTFFELLTSNISSAASWYYFPADIE